jgi:hypothetical protein
MRTKHSDAGAFALWANVNGTRWGFCDGTFLLSVDQAKKTHHFI